MCSVQSLKVPTKEFWALRHVHNDQFSTQILTVIASDTTPSNACGWSCRPTVAAVGPADFRRCRLHD
jgi:hypothetical protein